MRVVWLVLCVGMSDAPCAMVPLFAVCALRFAAAQLMCRQSIVLRVGPIKPEVLLLDATFSTTVSCSFCFFFGQAWSRAQECLGQSGGFGALPCSCFLDPQSPKGGGQRACHTEGAHPTASGRRKEVVLFRQTYPALTNGGVDNAVVPCGP